MLHSLFNHGQLDFHSIPELCRETRWTGMNSIKKPQKLEKSADLDLVVFVMMNLVYQTGVMVKVICTSRWGGCPGVTGKEK